MTSLNLTIRKILWAALAALAFLFWKHYLTTGLVYAQYWPDWKETMFFCESWANVWLIVLFVSLIMLLREK
jgi:hypothetical protein